MSGSNIMREFIGVWDSRTCGQRSFIVANTNRSTSQTQSNSLRADQLSLVSVSVCLTFSHSMSAVAVGLQRSRQPLSCSNRQPRTIILSPNARLVSPQHHTKLPCNPNTSPAVVHHGSNPSMSILTCKTLRRCRAPRYFSPSPLTQMSSRTPLVSMVWFVGDQLRVLDDAMLS